MPSDRYDEPSVAGTPVVVVPRVGGGALVVVVTGAWVVVVSCWVVVVAASVVVVSTGAGAVVATVPVERGAVVFTTGAREVVAVVSAEPGGRVVTDVSGTVDELDEGADDEVGARVVGVVVVGRMVVVGAWVATCCLAELSVPVATSNRRATRAMDART